MQSITKTSASSANTLYATVAVAKTKTSKMFDSAFDTDAAGRGHQAEQQM
jgi:hypothetical protein